MFYVSGNVNVPVYTPLNSFYNERIVSMAIIKSTKLLQYSTRPYLFLPSSSSMLAISVSGPFGEKIPKSSTPSSTPSIARASCTNNKTEELVLLRHIKQDRTKTKSNGCKSVSLSKTYVNSTSS